MKNPFTVAKSSNIIFDSVPVDQKSEMSIIRVSKSHRWTVDISRKYVTHKLEFFRQIDVLSGDNNDKCYIVDDASVTSV